MGVPLTSQMCEARIGAHETVMLLDTGFAGMPVLSLADQWREVDSPYLGDGPCPDFAAAIMNLLRTSFLPASAAAFL